MFINYDVNRGLSINSYRHPSATMSKDVAELVDDIIADQNGCCPLEGAKDALEDGSVWQGSDATHELLEELHALIRNYEKN